MQHGEVLRHLLPAATIYIYRAICIETNNQMWDSETKPWDSNPNSLCGEEKPWDSESKPYRRVEVVGGLLMDVEVVKLYYVYTLEDVKMIYHVEVHREMYDVVSDSVGDKVEFVMMYHKVYHVKVYCKAMYCEEMYCEEVVNVMYMGVLVDRWIKPVDNEVLDSKSATVGGFADYFLGQCGEGHIGQEEVDILEERFPFLNLRSGDVAHEVLGTLCSYECQQRWEDHQPRLLLLVENQANGDGSCSVAKCWHGNWNYLVVTEARWGKVCKPFLNKYMV